MRLLLCPLLMFSGWSRAAEHWAYVAPVQPKVASVAGEHPVDALLAVAWKQAGVVGAPPAPPRRWIERAAYTLTGLPPTAEQIQRIEKSPDEGTWRAMVDEMLASPTYGERWARHWMDVARYADTRGYNFDQDNRYPFAYTYRDWLIRAFNEDLPYGDFIKLQLAADLVTDRPDHPDLAALGFITTGPRGGGVETVDDRIDVITRGFLSSTVACARCHDHKFDPITQRDYFSLYSILENTEEPETKPIIGNSVDPVAGEAFKAEMAKLEAAETAARQEIIDQLRAPESGGIYLELAWQAKQGNWDVGAATGPAFKRGRYRPAAVIRWRDTLDQVAWGDQAGPRLAAWAKEMAATDDAGRAKLCRALVEEAAAAPEGSELKSLATRPDCPWSFNVGRIPEIYDAEDGNQSRKRAGAVTRLLTEHPGSPPRAMSLVDRKNWAAAQIFVRGNPNNRGETFDREWLGFLGGGKFPEGKSPRFALAEKIADPANPLTARVFVNRVWAWNFGSALADPEDFGTQQDAPPLLPLLDWLALRFNQDGGSLKALQRIILTSKAFRLESDGSTHSKSIDEAGSLFWKWNRRRVDFESMRDRLLASAGTLDHKTIGGRSVSIETSASDPRRSLYAFVDRYALAGTFVSFDFPHPDHHSPKRAETTVPQQALYFLNGGLAIRQAAKLVDNPEFGSLPNDQARVAWLYQRIYQRAPGKDELQEAVEWIKGAQPADYEPRLSGHWEVRHAPDTGIATAEPLQFPIFADGVWKTGPDPGTAPIPWLNAGAGGGHPGTGQQLIIRWRALGAGQARLVGSIKRAVKGGATLVWNVANKNQFSVNHPLGPAAESTIQGEWTDVAAGDTLDFVLRAPDGDTNGSVIWDLNIEGRESASGKTLVVGNFREKFPKPDSPQPSPTAGNPWADLVQMLWASNEFHFID